MGLGLRTPIVDRAFAIIVAVFCLHNYAVRGEEPLPDDDGLPPPPQQPPQVVHDQHDNQGDLARRRIIEQHFTIV